MLNKKTARAVIAWLLAVLFIFSFAGCDSGEVDVPEVLPKYEGGALSSLRIAGKNAEFMEPERKSAYYLSLDEVGKKLYDAAYTTLCANETSFKLIGIDIGSFAAAYRSTLAQFMNDYPEFFWLNGYIEYETVRASNSDTGHITITFGIYDYWIDHDLEKAKAELRQALDAVVLEASALPDDYQKAKFVHDYIICSNSYDFAAYELGDAINAETEARVSSAYGALVSGDIMCAGYANAFNLVMYELGYESIFVSGEADGGAHAWNLVLLGDNFYHIDLTWDDLDGNRAEVRYNYFCLSDEEISKTHKVEEGFDYPEATATEYNYFVKEGMYLDYYSFAAVTKLAKKYKGDGVFAFKCYDAKVMADAVEELVQNNMIFKLAGFENVESFQYIADEDTNILSFYIE
ncbi:MAG: hypothetical protein IKK74_06020 [Clostridia bacterium]|nr:hypothetical protein [Clostridia bacterium]